MLLHTIYMNDIKQTGLLNLYSKGQGGFLLQNGKLIELKFCRKLPFDQGKVIGKKVSVSESRFSENEKKESLEDQQRYTLIKSDNIDDHLTRLIEP